MSATTVNQECEHCGDEFETFHTPGYCSEYCFYSAEGTSILNTLKYDHRFCHGCFAKLKEVEKPTAEQLRHVKGQQSTECIIGFQYTTPTADIGEKTIQDYGANRNIITGVVCGECGTTDHRDDFQRDFSIQDAAKRLRKRVQETRDEGQHSYEWDTEAFVEAWNEHTEWAVAVGMAISDSL